MNQKPKRLGVEITKGQLADNARLLGDIHQLSNQEIAAVLLEVAELYGAEH